MKRIAILGLGQFGYQVAIGLTQKGFDVLALDNDEDIISEIKDLVSQAIIADSTDEKAMRSVNIDNVDVAIVAVGSNMQSSLLTTALLQRMSVSQIYVRVINSLQESILRSMGIENIISIEKEMGIQVANTLSEGVGRYIPISDRHAIMEVQIPPRFIGKRLKDLNLRTQYKLTMLGLKTASAHVEDDGHMAFDLQMNDSPEPTHTLAKDDRLIIAGRDDDLNTFLKIGDSLD